MRLVLGEKGEGWDDALLGRLGAQVTGRTAQEAHTRALFAACCMGRRLDNALLQAKGQAFTGPTLRSEDSITAWAGLRKKLVEGGLTLLSPGGHKLFQEAKVSSVNKDMKDVQRTYNDFTKNFYKSFYSQPVQDKVSHSLVSVVRLRVGLGSAAG